MKYTLSIQRAIKFCVKTHEVYQKQKRKGKDIPYITHPMTVGFILSLAGASEEVIIAGLLHDTIEDSADEKKVTKEMLAERFGQRVADLVDSVTESDKARSWEERKQDALSHIEYFDHDSLLLKSADILGNMAELIDDYMRHGDEVFCRFNAPKERLLMHYQASISAISAKWPESPLAEDLNVVFSELDKLYCC